jgi:hypothetical protein
MNKPTDMSVQELHDANHLYLRYHDYERLKEHYIKAGLDETEANRLTNGLTLYHKQKRHHRAVILTAVGSVLLIFGFILSMIFYKYGMNIHYALFGPTAIGAVMLTWA